ncbi:LOW QUALITY PROTEIN: occludin/ELL domain-containing protein 1 [Orycteropus afer afer]|uniref:LOW QUALITY PROTEIN: occludin/ELL domain-containing protein 1 n=1 Tax=Orycteropus afer afer TaxID=1230840 RepID=A0A8B7A6C8_ORYAF|nr:LOW QUALITY PROTEIN: occludin/ELL domain-containing protein 1 [Orycteropus afer afer]
MHNRNGRGSPEAYPGSESRTLGQAALRPLPPRAGQDTTRRNHPLARGPLNSATQRPMPTWKTPETRGSRGNPQRRPPGPGPPRQDLRDLEASSPYNLCQLQSRAHRMRPKKIVFEDELPPNALLRTRKPIGATSRVYTPRPHPVPDYELKYPPVSSERERSRYVAVFQDQYSEFLELRQKVASAQAKLQQLKTLLSSLPPPHSQKEARVTAHVWREFEKKQMDPSFLEKQARYHYLKGKLRHLKTQIQKFDDQEDSKGSVYF